MQASLRLVCLGRLSIHYQLEQQMYVLQKPPTLKSQSLLAYLAVHRHKPQSREMLTGMFWGDRPTDKARRSLSTALWHIRRCFPEDDNPIQGDNQAVQFQPQVDVWLDVEQFEINASAHAAQQLQTAIDLYEGNFLEDLYDDWVIDTRYRLQALYIDALSRLMSHYEAQTQYDDALHTAFRLLDQDLLREDAHRLIMRTYVHLGQRNAALKQYERCRQIVQSELGAEPTAETIDLYQAIRAGHAADEAPAAPHIDEAPASMAITGHDPLDVAAPNMLAGREEDLAYLIERWQHVRGNRSELVLLSGEAGVGKTRLVEAFADQLRGQGVQVLWGRCYEFERRLPFQPIAEALTPLLSRMSASELSHLPDWVNVALARLVPIIIDKRPEFSDRLTSDIEHARLFNGITRFLATLSARSPLLLVVEDLHWASESTLELIHYLVRHLVEQPLLFIGTVRDEALDAGHALRSLQQQLQLEGLAQSHALGRLSLDTVTALLERMSGAGASIAPLAARLQSETEGNPFFLVETIKALFESDAIYIDKGIWRGDFTHISQSQFGMPATVRDAILARTQRLSDPSKDVLRVGSVLGREFDFDLLHAVCEQSEDATLAALDALLRNRLIIEGRGATDRDYVFTHHKIQEVVRDDPAFGARRHRQLIHARAGAAMEQLYANQLAAYASEIAFHFENGRLIDKAIDYLRMAGDQAAKQFANAEAIDYFNRALGLLSNDDHARRFDLLLAREKIYDLQGTRDAQAQDVATLEHLAHNLSEAQRAMIKLRRGNFAEVTGDYPAAISAAQSAIALAQASDSANLEAACYLQLGRAHWRQSDYDAARLQFEQALALARSAHLRDVEADALRNLGNVALRQAKYADASAHFEQALHIFREIGDREGQALVLGHLGNIAIDQSAYAEAVSTLEQALSILRDIGYREGEANVLNSLGLLASNRGDHAAAIAYYDQTLSIRREIGDRQGESLALVNFGYVSWLRQDYTTAMEYLTKALPISREIGDRRIEGLALLNLGYVAMCQAEYAAASKYLDQGLAICRDIGDRPKEGWGLSILGNVFDALGDYATARAYFEQALRICDELGDRETVGWRLADLALVAHHIGDDVEARDYSERSLKIAHDLENRLIEAYALTMLAHALSGLGQLAEATVTYEQALVVRNELKQVRPAMDILAGLARVALESGDRMRARTLVDELLHRLESHSLAGIDEPFRVYLICYEVLSIEHDPRAQSVLDTAHRLLQEQAAKIEDDDLRRSFLENVHTHREIVAAFNAHR